ncbi:MAG: NUDIX hydrolase [Phycisphaerae bacterium]
MDKQFTDRVRNLPVFTGGVSVYVVKEPGPDDAHHLLLKRSADESYCGLWQQVTGAVHEGETAPQAAVREVGEETGLTPTRLYSANQLQSFYDPHRDGITTLVVLVAFVPPGSGVVLSEEHDEFRWVCPGEAVKMFTFREQGESLMRIEDDFVRRQPTEGLRLPLE